MLFLASNRVDFCARCSRRLCPASGHISANCGGERSQSQALPKWTAEAERGSDNGLRIHREHTLRAAGHGIRSHWDGGAYSRLLYVETVNSTPSSISHPAACASSTSSSEPSRTICPSFSSTARLQYSLNMSGL